MWNNLHYIIRAYAYACARKEKGIVLTEMKGFSGTFTHQKNASAFDLKRKGVSLQTQVRFPTNKNKRKYYTEMGIKKGVPLNSNLC